MSCQKALTTVFTAGEQRGPVAGGTATSSEGLATSLACASSISPASPVAAFPARAPQPVVSANARQPTARSPFRMRPSARAYRLSTRSARIATNGCDVAVVGSFDRNGVLHLLMKTPARLRSPGGELLAGDRCESQKAAHRACNSPRQCSTFGWRAASPDGKRSESGRSPVRFRSRESQTRKATPRIFARGTPPPCPPHHLRES